jgi:hypothetical protein
MGFGSAVGWTRNKSASGHKAGFFGLPAGTLPQGSLRALQRFLRLPPWSVFDRRLTLRMGLSADIHACGQELPWGFGFVVYLPKKRNRDLQIATLALNCENSEPQNPARPGRCREFSVERFRGLPKIDWECERGDSNPHAFRHQILSLARLPIPPLSLANRLCLGSHSTFGACR